MKTPLLAATLCIVAGLPWLAQTAYGQAAIPTLPSRETTIVDAAIDVLGEIMAIPGKSIPAGLLAKAEGVAIIPGTLKGGFILGIRHGRGVILTRDKDGKWKAPIFVDLTGASIGWQAGVQGTDLVLVFRTKQSVQNLMTGKFKIGATASAAAGPVGREAEAATDATITAEILSYSRSRGLFAGVALDGTMLSVDQAATNAYYQPSAPVPPGQPIPLPASAGRLLEQLAKYTTVTAPAPAGTTAAPVGVPAGTVPAAAPADPDALRRQLAASSQQLSAIVDPQWRTYLALPAEVYAGARPPSAEALRVSLDHFATVAANPRYQTLSQRAEFQTTLSLLRQYAATLAPAAAQPLALPPPPK